MNVYEIIEIIENLAPTEMAIEGDNVGLQVGEDREVNKLGVALDPSLEVIKKAVKEGVDFLFTHHPLLKDPINKFTGVVYKKLELLINNKIVLYSAHTNLDVAFLNDALSELFNLKNIQPLYDNGLGRVGIFEGTFKELLDIVKENLCKNPIVVNPKDIENFKLAVLSGYGLSQKSIIHAAKNSDVYISGDLTHHARILAEDMNFSVIDATHYGTEVYGLKKFKNILEEKLDVEIISLDF
ncbi:hypothetical protein J422_04488 [Methanocaldococcus villosus KIN24-T80]|uniref:NGG1p interacting factor 3 protein, NIF3 n=1 Tax=Methanocaldococcus villosus KIN24-T80 TaxID=1069083 RepID=N6VQE9_9EURY|nr:Nif3-like dinuclear metal center hexameric protein [Methanocaldococcus villosus]ENN96095.1 hypothetical protein J422_04488 [Methanocaldococcus villosus KIN24-T80]